MKSFTKSSIIRNSKNQSINSLAICNRSDDGLSERQDLLVTCRLCNQCHVMKTCIKTRLREEYALISRGSSDCTVVEHNFVRGVGGPVKCNANAYGYEKGSFSISVQEYSSITYRRILARLVLHLMKSGGRNPLMLSRQSAHYTPSQYTKSASLCLIRAHQLWIDNNKRTRAMSYASTLHFPGTIAYKSKLTVW